MLHLESVLLSLLLPLAVLTLPLFVEGAANERLVHLLVGVVAVYVVHGWALRDDDASCAAQIIQMRFHDVLIREYFRLGLLGRSAGCNTLVAQLSHDVAAHGGTHLQLVLGWQTAQVLQIGRNSLADHDRAGEAKPLLFAQVGAAPHLLLGLVVT